MRKLIAITALLAATGGCATFEAVAPNTVAGFEANGIIGAIDGASGAALALCERADGEQFRVAIDNLADNVGAGSAVDRARKARQRACDIAGGAKDVTSSILDEEAS